MPEAYLLRMGMIFDTYLNKKKGNLKMKPGYYRAICQKDFD